MRLDDDVMLWVTGDGETFLGDLEQVVALVEATGEGKPFARRVECHRIGGDALLQDEGDVFDGWEWGSREWIVETVPEFAGAFSRVWDVEACAPVWVGHVPPGLNIPNVAYWMRSVFGCEVHAWTVKGETPVDWDAPLTAQADAGEYMVLNHPYDTDVAGVAVGVQVI